MRGLGAVHFGHVREAVGRRRREVLADEFGRRAALRGDLEH
jgi:hypothetical protein